MLSAFAVGACIGIARAALNASLSGPILTNDGACPATLYNKSFEPRHGRLWISAVGNDLHARLHAVAGKIDGHIAAVPALEEANVWVIGEHRKSGLTGRRIGGDGSAHELCRNRCR